MGFFRRRRTEADWSLVAEQIIDATFGPGFEPLDQEHVGASSKERFDAKVRLFLTTALMMLATQAQLQRGKVAAPLFEALRTRLLAGQPPEFMEAYLKAGHDLSDLTTNWDRRHLFWADEWLKDVGIEVANPATWVKFSCLWANQWIFIHDLVFGAIDQFGG